ncbi:MAG: hypothetical protein RI601_07985, partial [Desulfurivibrionaceae bacterium]|nr:hypothetical protein [Desulfurivibrionaceae bacterium]
ACDTFSKGGQGRLSGKKKAFGILLKKNAKGLWTRRAALTGGPNEQRAGGCEKGGVWVRGSPS